MKTRVVHKNKEPFDIDICRPGKWGNPFIIGKDGTRTEVIIKFREWILSQPKLIEDAKKELKGRVLGCWCNPKKCHGDIYIELIDNEEIDNVRNSGNKFFTFN